MILECSGCLQGDAGGASEADQAMQSEVGDEEEIKEDSPQNDDNDDTNDSDQGETSCYTVNSPIRRKFSKCIFFFREPLSYNFFSPARPLKSPPLGEASQFFFSGECLLIFFFLESASQKFFPGEGPPIFFSISSALPRSLMVVP